MKYTSYFKCTVISPKHVVFDFKIYRQKPIQIENSLVAEGNIVISEELTYYMDSVKMLNLNDDDDAEVDCKMDKIIKVCLERAKWIFESNVQAI